MTFAASCLVAVILIMITSIFHYEMLERLSVWTARRTRTRHGLSLRALNTLIGVHLAEILAYAAAYALAERSGLGRLASDGGAIDALSFIYFSAETYSTLGYGDIQPRGMLRTIAAVESLNGLLLLAWSGAFLFSLVSTEAAAQVGRNPKAIGRTARD